MSSVSLTGEDTIIVNNRVISDLADADCATLDFPNDISALKTGKNGNTIYAINQTGKQCEVKIRVLRGSADDKFLNNLMASQTANFAGFVLMSGEFIKKVGDGKGKITSDTYIMSGGVFKKFIPAKSNVEGDPEQSVCEYMFAFSNAPRALT